MRLLLVSLVMLFVLALSALEILAARGVSDADVPGNAAVHLVPPASSNAAIVGDWPAY
jgi:hypothetical protein